MRMLLVRTQVFCLALAVFKDGRSLLFRSVLPGCGAHIQSRNYGVKMCGFSNLAETISPDDTNVIQSELVSGESEKSPSGVLLQPQAPQL
jgi:hypothetical protein